ncbi:MAG: SpoIIE family protein phosphatase [Bdellovibrionaceae bacterium]|nr:SpoIIE family protein phosphatase [Pseudobdellovibrionaceae bacterium]
MKKISNTLKEKIFILEKKLKERDLLLKKYKKALMDSNKRITNISQKLEDSLSIIHDINKNLVPVRLPSISGFELSHKFLSANKGVSGDFFDIIFIKNTMKFGIILSSCNTYSLTSLFLSSFLKSADNIHKCKTSKDFVSLVEKKMKIKSYDKTEKINLFYGVISRSSLYMDYCLVGDIFVSHKRDGENFNTLRPCVTNLLHKKATTPFQNGKLILEPKDTLLVCSPGIIYRKNKTGENFGHKNIIISANKKKSSSVLKMRQNILFDCNEFGKNQINKRDSTILVIKVMDSILKLKKSFN